MAEDLGEKTEDATPKRRTEAREEGRVARSMDLGGSLALVAVTIILWAAMMPMLGNLKIMLESILNGSTVSSPIDPNGAWTTARYCGSMMLRALAPIVLLTWVGTYLVNFIQVGWMISPKATQPKLSKLNPISGAKRIFGLSGLVKVIMDSLKVLIVMVVSAQAMMQHSREIVTLPYLSLMQGLGAVGSMMLDVAIRVLAVLVFLAILDYAYQRWKHNEELKMTKQQVKDEMKQSEGDPEVKRRRMRMQMQIAMQRIGTAVPKADVIVTNPEHYAVAIQYEQDAMNAPKVVAKGADYLALRIRQIALKHGIPIVERKPLAQALYKQVPVGQEVPPEFFKAVAEILAYVYRLNGKMAG